MVLFSIDSSVFLAVSSVFLAISVLSSRRHAMSRSDCSTCPSLIAWTIDPYTLDTRTCFWMSVENDDINCCSISDSSALLCASLTTWLNDSLLDSLRLVG
ncbi:hypothetical protein B0O80DRAFT_442347, partial [Mortierella sp. GBAus27b]